MNNKGLETLLLEKIDPRVPIIIQRSSRRRYTFGRSSPHEWRRDERSAYDRHKQSDGTHRDSYVLKVVDNLHRKGIEFGDNDPQDIGTNAILREFGMDRQQRDEAFAFYGKEVVKPASRIAVMYARDHGLAGIKTEIANLFEAVYWLGTDVVTDMVKKGVKPSDIMRGEAIKGLLEYTLPPTYIRRPLEVVAGNADVNTDAQLVVGVPYQTAYALRRQRR